MTGAGPGGVRPMVAAGRFYESDPARCAAAARSLCTASATDLPVGTARGALVPHAGWICSGRVAGATITVLATRTEARTVVLLGTMHARRGARAATDASAAWRTPIGVVPVDEGLRAEIEALDGFESGDDAHRTEHCIEVVLPLLRTAFGDALTIVPAVVPRSPDAPAWGRALGRCLAAWPVPVAVVASSDLTHYGPAFGFTPHGPDVSGHRWAHEVNDQELVDLALSMRGEEVARHAAEHHSACGGAALAATIEACRGLGAERGVLVAMTDSAREVPALAQGGGSVGYAGMVFGAS